MFVRNFLSSGDYVQIIPLGLLTTLQYSDKGAIEKVYLNHNDDDLVDVTDTFLSNVLEQHIVPTTIPVKDGTTYVKGVLYTPEFDLECGDLPEAFKQTLSEKFVEEPEKFAFYAGSVKSYARAFNGAVNIRQWLTFAKFNLLPGSMMPATLQDEQAWFKATCSNSEFTFKYPYISNVIVFKQGKPITLSTKLTIKQVVDIEMYEEVSGNIACKLKFEDDFLDVDVATVDRMKIGVGSYLLLDDECNIIYVDNLGSTSPYIINDTISCITCGAPIIINPNAIITSCPDSHCPSKMFIRFERFCRLLGLPYELSEEELDAMIGESVVEHKMLTFGRLLDCPTFSDLKLNTSLFNVLRAVIPETVVSTANSNVIEHLCRESNNSLTTLEYILSHIDKFVDKLNLTYTQQTWLEDSDNIVDIMSVLRHSSINIDEKHRKFDGPPIFRDKIILITGEFMHGSYSEVSAILQSYGATVIDKFNDTVNCVVVGDTKESVNGSYIKAANNARIPVFEENKFFTEYDIDNDISNLL